MSEDLYNRIHFGDCRAVLPKLAAAGVRVQTCVTSPPYWGLRDYGTGTWEGGDPAREHLVRENGADTDSSTLGGSKATAGHQREGFRGECPRCGAKRIDSQIGLEDTPEEYVQHLVEVFRAVRSVLADDGVIWVNLGDSYAGSGRGGNPAGNSSTLDGGLDSQEASMTPRSRLAGIQSDGSRAAAVTQRAIQARWMVGSILRKRA